MRPAQTGVQPPATHIPAALHDSPATVHVPHEVPPHPSSPHSRPPLQSGVHTHIPALLHVSGSVHEPHVVPPHPSSPHSRPPLQSGVHEHACVLQAWLVGPVHGRPPLEGAGLVHVRVWVPPPHGTLQAPQSVKPPFTGPHTCVLHAWLVGPSQSAPPLAGTGFVHVRVCVPVPHGALHAPQSVQPPSTGASVHVRPSSPSGAGAGMSTQARPSSHGGAFTQASMSSHPLGVSSSQV
jgi:hypothetical protein